MLEPRVDFRPLAAKDLIEVRGGIDLGPPLVPSQASHCGCHADVSGNVGNMNQNPETPPNKLDFNSMIG